jgi:Flp pilus assembly protein TadG
VIQRLGARRDDAGAYAILYGLLILAMCGVAAIVVDLGALRQNRRETRLASDAAVIAGARDLNASGAKSNPQQACKDAWSYLATNLGFTVPANTGCTTFPTSYADPCPYATALAYTPVKAGDYTVTITWPVSNTSTLMTKPNAAPAAPAQPIDTNTDGTDICTRVGVTVAQVSHPAFAGVFGVGDQTTTASSVGRSTISPGTTGPVAALNVLNKTACQVIDTSGQGSIVVSAVGTQAGIISVESSGRAAGCANNKYVIDVGPATSPGFTRADGPGGQGQGTILEYALNTAPTGNPPQAYLPGVPPGKLAPIPTVLSQRLGATPVTNVYGCNSGCSAPYITNLRTAYKGTTLIPTNSYAASPAPYNALPFVPFVNCSIKSSDKIVMPAANYWINCPGGLSVKGLLVFKGGNVVSQGGIDLSNGGCFAVNVPVASSACPTIVNGEVATKPATESILYIRSGNISRIGGSFFAANTFTYLEAGVLSLGGGGSTDTVLMTNPRLDTVPAGCATACQDARFWKASLWSESSTTQVIGGQGSLLLRGVLFVPNSLFNYGGQATQQQVGAQFWTDSIQDSGKGQLTMAPLPGDSFPSPLLGTALIR